MTYPIDCTRLWASLEHSASIGASKNGGLDRVSLTDSDRQARDWFRSECSDASCIVTTDNMGNMFARRAGRESNRSPIVIGSHLDSQPSGGRYDGALGVLAALEVVRTLNAFKVQTRHPIEIVNWTNEEGARFPPTMFGSAVFAGTLSKKDAYRVNDQHGNTFLHELERIGYRGPEACGEHPIAGYCEVHIEQGPILEENDARIGVVTGIQGMRWYDIAIEGVAGHAGTTPMHLRKDALVGAANLIERFRQIAMEYDRSAVVTTGSISVSPGSRNVIAGRATVSLDVRHPSRRALEDLERAFDSEIEELRIKFGLVIGFDRILASNPIEFDPRCVEAVRSAALSEGVSHLNIMSGATHDAANIAPLAPTAMIFVPCAGGVSHNEMESISSRDAHMGAQILLDTVLQYDEILD